MRFTQIELYNFGLYKGLHKIDLQVQKKNKNITLIGGLNGRGKTTILEAIFIAFYGKRSMRAIQDKRTGSYPKMLSERVNKSAEDEKASVAVSCVLDEKEEREILIKRSWRKQGKSTADSLEIKVDGLLDSVLSQNWNYYVEEILPISISRFFFFDNERISQIAEDESFEEIKSSIKSIMGITTVDILENDARKLLKAKSGQLEAIGSEELRSERKELEESIEKVKENLATAEQQKNKLISEIATISKTIEDLEEAFWRDGGLLGTNRKKFEKNKELLKYKKEEIANKMQSVVASALTPLYLCKDLVFDTIQKCEENEKAIAQKYTNTLIMDLEQRVFEKIKDAFGGTEVEEKLIKIISTEFDQYIGDQTVGIGFSISKESMALLNQLSNGEFQRIFSECIEMVNEYHRVDEELLRVNDHLSNKVNELELKEQYQEIRIMEEEKAAKTAELGIVEKEASVLNNQLKEMDKKLYSLLERAAEAEEKVTDASRVIKYTTMTLQVMDEFKKRLQKNKVYKLQYHITKCFNFLAGKQNMLSCIEIDSESLDIHLIDSVGQEVLKSQLSAGEKQIFAVSVLWGLAISSGYQMPVVIDTPMARLDSLHRKNFVSKYLPNASDQVIVLSTDEEIYGEYLEEIAPFVNSYYTLEYDEKDETTSIKKGYFGEKLCS